MSKIVLVVNSYIVIICFASKQTFLILYNEKEWLDNTYFKLYLNPSTILIYFWVT